MTTVETYFKSLTPEQRSLLEHVREVILKIAPDAVEGIGYGMPIFKLDGKYLIGYCAFKNHSSVFPGPAAIESVADKITEYTTAKGTIQFTAEHPLPDAIIEALVRHRLAAIAEAKK